MNAVAAQFVEKGIGSIFVYTHEAHPGENYPHITSMEEKFAHARDLRDKLNVTRQILVDALDGACHRAYGSMPNMTWIFNRTGTAVYKSDWTDAKSVEMAIAYYLDVNARRAKGERLAGFHVQRVDYRNHDRDAFYNGLARSGQKAVDEFKAAF